VVGAGPAGMVLSMVLARVGIKVTLLEKESTTDERPRAAHLTPPTMRLLRRAGLAEDVRCKGWTPNNFAWRKLDGTIITSIQDFAQSKNPDSMVVLPLGPLGKIILEHASREDNITIKFNHCVVGVGQDDQSAWALVRKEDGSEFKVAGDYVVGCDGGTSSVRKSLYGPRNFPGQTWDERLIASNVGTILTASPSRADEPTIGHLSRRQIRLGRPKYNHPSLPTRTYRKDHPRRPMARLLHRRQYPQLRRSAQ
jgi:2-polyprenyl-6-methoxyphenol hydroxylase-like FAD-dependent oxidoreductase